MSANAGLAVPADTLARQRLASDPAASAWVSANAGSGKTFVLTRRVVRLLLGGVPPSRILCLTFTKAAAANMSIRVFDILATWVRLDDAALTQAIVDTGAPRPGPADLAAARRLFARTVESPGGLKILTLHAFCEKLLHAFPFEANVTARFTVIEEIRQQELLGRAREATLAEAVARPGSRLGQAVEALSRSVSETSFDALVGEVALHAGALRESLRRLGGIERLSEALANALNTGGQTVRDIERLMLDGLPRSEWDSIGRRLVSLADKGNAAGEALIRAAQSPEGAVLDVYLDVFLTKELKPRADTYLPKKIRAAEPALSAALDAERGRLVDLLGRRRAAEAFERTMALLTVADAILTTYETSKRRRGLLDFGDLIERTRVLLSRSDSAWVLYKLDSGIDHVLVDEAQDTSPDQWEILRAITRDFFAGEGQSRTNRTFFAVGDEKQSIYSFQGARPAMFEATHQDYKARAVAAGLPFASIDLLLSFRSVTAVLDVVDRVFAHADNARGLSAGSEGPMPHEALKKSLPGLVEIWPPVEPAPAQEPSDWRLPVDLPDASDPAVVLARRIADTVRSLVGPGSADTVQDGDKRRSIGPGDILILVRSRNAFFDAVIRALKERHVPVAGADRLNLTHHIAVMDLMAAGRAALLPDDDLTLACVLKSPLIGLDDDDLLRLAPGRTGSLAEALADSAHPRDRVAAQRVAIWRDYASTLTPFAFYTRLLGAEGGRRAFLARLGPEAGDVIDEFMALTLAHERDGAPSLLAFLARLENAELSVKRDMDAAGNAVRVMTIHAAKGLEAKIVFLPDTCGSPSGRHDAKLFRLGEEATSEPALLVWSPKADLDPPAVAAKRDAGREAAIDEHRRLLYVALTRAEERLYIAGFHGERGRQPGCWYDMITAADLGTEPVVAPWDAGATIRRRSDPVTGTAASGMPAAVPKADLPEWIHRPAPREDPVAPPIRPSNALGAADHAAGDGASAAGPPESASLVRLAGRLLHRLVQHLPSLPPVRRRDAGLRFLATQGRGLAPERHAALVDDALRVLEDPALVPLFGPDSRAEVAVAATVALPGGRSLAVSGQIDRIGVTPEGVFIADYKTGKPRSQADMPPSHVAQLALYRAAVQPLYPGKPVRAFIVWTNGPVVIEIAADALDAAVDRLATE